MVSIKLRLFTFEMPAAFRSSYNHSKRSGSEERKVDRHFVYIEPTYIDDKTTFLLLGEPGPRHIKFCLCVRLQKYLKETVLVVSSSGYMRSRYREQNSERYRGVIVSQIKPKLAL